MHDALVLKLSLDIGGNPTFNNAKENAVAVATKSVEVNSLRETGGERKWRRRGPKKYQRHGRGAVRVGSNHIVSILGG